MELTDVGKGGEGMATNGVEAHSIAVGKGGEGLARNDVEAHSAVEAE